MWPVGHHLLNTKEQEQHKKIGRFLNYIIVTFILTCLSVINQNKKLKFGFKTF